MNDKGNGGSKGPFQDTPIFGKRKGGLPQIPKLPNLKLPLAGRKPMAFIVAILIVAVVVFNLFLVDIAPNEFGIKQVKIGIKRGIQEKVYETGLHLVIPGFEVMHTFPRDLQIFEMTNYPTAVTRLHRYEKAAHIQTSDGFFVDVDLTLIFRIVDPYLVITTVGPGRFFEDNGIIPKAEPILKQALGVIPTEEFYNSALRVEKTLVAKKLLNEELNPKGIHVEHVLVRYFQYSAEIQKNIEAKKLQDQLVFKNQAERGAAEEAAKLSKVVAEGEAFIKIKLQEGEAYQVQRLGERDLYVRTKHANGDLLVKLAEARKTELKNAALRGAGSARLVGLKMAEVYEGLEMIILSSDGPSGVNPLDLESTLEMFEVRKGGKR